MLNKKLSKEGIGWTAANLEELLDGKWINYPSENWRASNAAIAKHECEDNFSKNTLFVAIDEKTWHEGSGNRGVYAGWNDTHKTLPTFQDKIVGAIVQRPIENLDPNIPQLLVENSYEAIKILGSAVRNTMNGKVVAITGTVGKSSTKAMIEHLLKRNSTVISTRGNHNSRTGVPLTLARAIDNPDYCLLEIAIAALWMKTGGICKLARPHIGVITEIGDGQRKTALETAQLKARICEGIVPNGFALLNRNMQHYDVAKAEVEKYGATAYSYGFTSDADAYIVDWKPIKEGSFVTANILGEQIGYILPLLGKGMIANSLCALTVAKLLNVDIQLAANEFLSYKTRKSVLELSSIDLHGGKASLLDDGWNAEILSMISAFEVLKQQAPLYKGKKIAILGRILNIDEKSDDLYLSLAKPLMESGVDIVFGQGEKIKNLLKALPSTMVGGYFSEAKACAQAVANIVRPDDFILIKGSREESDFGLIKKYLLEEIQKKNVPKNERSISSSSHLATINHGAVSFNMDTGEVLAIEGASTAIAEEGLGGVLLLSLLLRELSLKKVKLSDSVTISAFPVRAGKAERALGLREGDKVSVHTLLNAIICYNSPDAQLALAEKLYKTTNKALSEIQHLAAEIRIQKNSVGNVSGRRMSTKTQRFTINDLYKTAKELFSNTVDQLKLLSTSSFTYNGRTFTLSSHLIATGKAHQCYMFGENHSLGIALTHCYKKKILSIVIGARDAFHRDYLLTKVIDKASATTKENLIEVSEPIKLNKQNNISKINIIGDTYFGEFYTKIRQSKQIEDALTKYGYDYSFKGIQPILEPGDYNIANFEAVLTDLEKSPFHGIIPFILAGNPRKSISAMEKAGINAVTLGNNHMMDYGVEGLRQTLSAFKEANIPAFGAGINSEQAEKPIRFLADKHEIVCYSAYWYRLSRYQTLDFYAMGEEPGVACLSGGLLDKIKKEKLNNPNAFIIVITHWGIDFQPVKPVQRQYAKQIVNHGADLIIGHGAHMMQEINKIDNKWILYSIGNGVFNSNGEYSLRHVPAYSFITQLRFHHHGKKEIYLYPIFCDNLKTFWQPRPVNEEEFNHLLVVQSSYGSPIEDVNHIQTGKDEYGYYILLPI